MRAKERLGLAHPHFTWRRLRNQYLKLCVWKLLSRVQLFVTPWTYTVHGILQARILELVAFPFPRGSFNPGIKPRSPTLQAASLPAEKGSPAILEWVRYPFCSRSSNTGIKLESLLHCRPFLYQLSCQGRPEVDGVSNRNWNILFKVFNAINGWNKMINFFTFSLYFTVVCKY